MSDRKEKPASDIGDAAWAYNRWPTVGLFTGGGLGAMLGVVFPPFGWLKLVAFIVVGLLAGCAVGFFTARVVFGRNVNKRHEDNDQVQS